jgi:hypothetical protein
MVAAFWDICRVWCGDKAYHAADNAPGVQQLQSYLAKWFKHKHPLTTARYHFFRASLKIGTKHAKHCHCQITAALQPVRAVLYHQSKRF